MKQIAATVGRVQIIYAGKAHPHDQGGKEVIRRIFEAKAALKTHVKIAYMVNYPQSANNRGVKVRGT